MTPFKMYDCDFGFKINGVDYRFPHVREVQIEDPERNNLTRGANASNKEGVPFREGLTEPKRWTMPVISMSIAIKSALDNAYDNQTRLDVYAIDRKTGSSKMCKNGLIANRPQQLSMNDTAESMDVSLEFVSFDSIEVYKA